MADEVVSAPVSTESGETSGQVEGKVEQKNAEVLPEWKKVKHKVKVDGQDNDVDYDELVRGYTHGKAANKRFQEAADIQRQATEIFSSIKNDPRAVKNLLKQFGHDFGKIAEEHILEQIKLEQMRPEERSDYERRQAERSELEELREMRRAQQEQEEITQRDSKVYEASQALDSEIGLLMDAGKSDPDILELALTMKLANTSRPLKDCYARAEGIIESRYQKAEKFDPSKLSEKHMQAINEYNRKKFAKEQKPIHDNNFKPSSQATGDNRIDAADYFASLRK